MNATHRLTTQARLTIARQQAADLNRTLQDLADAAEANRQPLTATALRTAVDEAARASRTVMALDALADTDVDGSVRREAATDLTRGALNRAHAANLARDLLREHR